MSEEKLTMDDYAEELEASFKKIEEGDILTGTVIAVTDDEIILDLKYLCGGCNQDLRLFQRTRIQCHGAGSCG